jgi:hypothetical protein
MKAEDGFCQDCRPTFARTVVQRLPGLLALSFARTVSLRLTSCRIELTQSLLNYPALRDSLASSFLTNLRKQAFDVVSK